MELMDSQTETAIRLLTRLAYGNVALVREALVKNEGKDVDAIIQYVRKHRRGGPPAIHVPDHEPPGGAPAG